MSGEKQLAGSELPICFPSESVHGCVQSDFAACNLAKLRVAIVGQ